MYLSLTEEQRKAVEQPHTSPVTLIDPVTHARYVLLPLDVYERLQAQVLDEFDPREAYPLVDRIMAEDDAQDPYLAEYQESQGDSP